MPTRKTDPELLDQRRRLNRPAGIALVALGVFALAALATYHGTDRPLFFHSGGAATPTQNLFGRAGATVAEGLLQTFGVAAFLFSACCVWLGWDRIRRWDEPFFGRVVAYGLILLSLSSLLQLFFGHVALRGSGPLNAGGFVGLLAANAQVAIVNTAGAWLISAATLAAVVILGWRESFARSAALVGGQLAGGGRRLSASWDTWQDRRSAQRAEREQATPPARPGAPARAAAPKAAPEPDRPPAAPPRPSISMTPAGTSTAATGEPPAPLAVKPPPVEPPPPRKPKQQALPMEPGERGYALPPLDLLNEAEPQTIESEQELLDRAQLITEKLQEFSVGGAVVAVHPGPVVTTFEFKPDAGVKYSKITSMNDDLSLALKAESVRIDRMPGRSTVGIEVPNRRQETIFPKDLMSSKRFKDSRSKLTLALGKDITGGVFTAELDRMPHLMIAGATGAGKSVGLNGMIASLLYKATPRDLRMIMIDTKMIELGIYADIPHLLIPVVTQPKQAAAALKWGVREMEQRYRKLAAVGVRNLAQYNDLVANEPERRIPDPKTGEPVAMEHLPYIVIVIDEMADLMMVSGAEVEESIMRLAQMARAVGIHLILATQRPSVDVITGTIKANFPSRIAFRVSQRVDSRTIIDQQGAEHLLGRGDMLFLSTGSARVVRLHGGFITEAELNRITSWLKKMAEPVYDETVLKDESEGPLGADDGERDEMYADAVRTVLNEGKCSITLIQRRLQLGYARAARIVDIMEREGVVSPGEGSKPREILVGPEVLESLGVQPHP